jgi:putative restriction endonuclease
MLAAADYIAITPSEARAQWRSIAARAVPPQGHRQVSFVPVETLLCLAASLVVNHRQYGGSSSHRAEEPVPTLARLFKRPNSSVLAKMANLYGGRSHGARHEVEVAARLLSETDELGAIYRMVVQAARDEGVGADDLPDFLGLEHDKEPLALFGQAELSTTDLAEVFHRENPGVTDSMTERLMIAAVRIGQHRFAREVLRNHGHRCVFCGFTLVIDARRAPRMLNASHIKPWRASDHRERIDVANGLAACPTHDAAFDSGLLTVDPAMNIHVHPQLTRAAAADPAVHAAFGRPPMAERLLLPAQAIPPERTYLHWHGTHVFRGTTDR